MDWSVKERSGVERGRGRSIAGSAFAHRPQASVHSPRHRCCFEKSIPLVKYFPILSTQRTAYCQTVLVGSGSTHRRASMVVGLAW